MEQGPLGEESLIMLPPLWEEYFLEGLHFWSVDIIGVLKYFICCKSEFKSICPHNLSHFQYQFNKSIFMECLQCTSNHGWCITDNVSFQRYDSPPKIGIICVLCMKYGGLKN